MSSTDTVVQSLRDERGLKRDTEYVFDQDGRVDWKAMLRKRPEFLYVIFDKKAEVDKKYGKDFDILAIDEKYLCISLPGINYLANLRGFSSAVPSVVNTVYDRAYEVAVSCTVVFNVTFVGNYETDMQPVSFGHVAGANLRNCFSFTQKFVETMAANRAWSKTVRTFLNINIVSKEEIGPMEEDPNAPITMVQPEEVPVAATTTNLPHAMLKDRVEKELKLTFTQFQSAVLKNHKTKIKSDVVAWKDYSSIPSDDCFKLLGIIAEREK